MPSLSPSTNTAAVSTTGAGIIKRALRILGVIDATEQLKPEELSQGLEALNSLLDSLNTERLMIYTRTHSSVSTSSATPTLGPGGTLDIVRPEKLDDGDVWLSSGSLDYPIRMMQHGEYAATASMSITAIPSAAYYDAGFPLGTLYFDSTMPSAMTLNVYSWKLHNQISNANAALILPPGLNDCLVFELAQVLAAEFGKTATPDIIENGNRAKANYKRMNMKPIEAVSDYPIDLPEGFVDSRSFYRGY
jgi:hypothetical protein